MKQFKKITEAASLYSDLHLKTTAQLLEAMNTEDRKVAQAVHAVLPQIEKLVDALYTRFIKGGRLFYVGAGTSGRLGVVDASEIPPTFGLAHDRVIGLIAGGDSAIRKAVEFAEDDRMRGWKDLLPFNPHKNDTVVGIASSGTTPYVLGAIETARSKGLLTAGICNNPGSPLELLAQIAIVPVVGPEFVTGSTRLKSGTSQKLVLNMISTALMIKNGRVHGNKMVHMQLSNNKLIDRGKRYLQESLQINDKEAAVLLEKHGSVNAVLEALKKK